MTNDPPPRFDPRFNPAFQPGYIPGTDDASSQQRRPQARPKLQQLGAPPVPVAPARPRLVVKSGSGAGDGPGDNTGESDRDGTHDGDRDEDDTVTSARDALPAAPPIAVPLVAQLRNPFLLALSALAVVLMGVGAWLFARTYAAFNDAGSFSTQGDFVALETLMRTSPLIIILGMGIAIGVVFLLAIGWRPRK